MVMYNLNKFTYLFLIPKQVVFPKNFTCIMFKTYMMMYVTGFSFYNIHNKLFTNYCHFE